MAQEPKQRNWRQSLRGRIKRALVVIRTKVPFGLRSLLGLVLIVGGFFGFLPILGFWMIPLGAAIISIDVAFYESTYFFAFSITDTPNVQGPATCTTEVIPFKADPQDTALQETLQKLGREETSGIENVGALFADRIALRCG